MLRRVENVLMVSIDWTAYQVNNKHYVFLTSWKIVRKPSSQDQVCDSNHAECVLFSQSQVPRRNANAYFVQHNTGCYQLCNNLRFPVGSQSMGVKAMRIDSVAHWLIIVS